MCGVTVVTLWDHRSIQNGIDLLDHEFRSLDFRFSDTKERGSRERAVTSACPFVSKQLHSLFTERLAQLHVSERVSAGGAAGSLVPV